jgi:hypothetical protein
VDYDFLILTNSNNHIDFKQARKDVDEALEWSFILAYDDDEERNLLIHTINMVSNTLTYQTPLFS